MISVIQNNDVYEIRFKYDPSFIALVKNVPGRRWLSEQKIWTIPKEHLGWLLNEVKGTAYESLLHIQSEEHINENASLDSTDKSEIPNIDISDMTQYVEAGSTLYDHQIDFLKYAKSKRKQGFILADDMGLGKTLEVMNLALYQRKKYGYKHCLIICCVNTSKYNWQEDIYKHTNGQEEAYILGTRRKRDGSLNKSTGGVQKLEDLVTGHMYGKEIEPELPYFLITNIETIRTGHGKYRPIVNELIRMIQLRQINMIAIDEVHKNVSPQSSQGKLILNIKKSTGTMAQWIPMTGTPIVKRPTDVFLPLKLVDGHSIKDYWSWCKAFVIHGGYGNHQVMGYKNIPQLKFMLQSNMLRRKKEDVLDLPEKIFINEYVENTHTQEVLYNNITSELIDNKESVLDELNPLVRFLKLRQVNGSPELIDPDIQIDSKYMSKNAKLQRLMELLEEYVDCRGEKVIVYSNWVEPLRTLYKFISKKYKTTCFTGTMSEEDRQKNKRVFQNNPTYKVMIGTIGALGTTHTLTAANNVIFYDEPWNYSEKSQAWDRVHRIGATKAVTITTILTRDTIDDRVHKIVYDKRDMSGYIVDGSLDIRRNPELFDKLLGKGDIDVI